MSSFGSFSRLNEKCSNLSLFPPPSCSGCKIKALRAKTNTYIKTPVRGEQPVFVVTGRKEDVAMAKREILSAAEHFSLIRASRNKAGPLTAVSDLGAPTLPGQTTIQVSKHAIMNAAVHSHYFAVNHIKDCRHGNSFFFFFNVAIQTHLVPTQCSVSECVISTQQVRVPYRVVGLVVGPKG